MKSESPVRRRVFWAVLSILFTAGALWAAIAGASVRLGSAAPFLAIWTATTLYLAISAAVRETRARSARTLPIPSGVLLRSPSWVRLGVPVYVVGLGAVLAAIAAACGFRTLGNGVLIAAAILAVPFFIATRRIGVTGVAFDPEGLRAHLGTATFFVPWANIAHVEAVTRRKIVRLQLRETGSVFRSLDPDTPRTRARLSMLALDGRGRVMLAPWLGCLDTATLERAIKAAIDHPPTTASVS